ncbi:MAG: glucuronate isomerase [Lentisphaeria bacterium]|nr:glucuronate isomerase [Lentisphaeria bacterium]
MSFLDGNYLLSGETAKTIYQQIAGLPILDAHNHADVKRIADNIPFNNPWELFAATDHYVWEIERKCGVAEEFITGKASDQDKWRELCRVFPLFAGNPVYEWVHLDLRFLGVDSILCEAVADETWKKLCKILASEECLPQNLVRRMNIEVMCSTDDPLDELEYHDKAEQAFGKRLIRPTWRPDKAMNIFKPDWNHYIDCLGMATSRNIDFLEHLVETLKYTHDRFAKAGTIASDHGIECPFDGDASEEEVKEIFHKVRIEKEKPTAEEAAKFGSYMLKKFAEMDAEKGWVFQLHIGAVRDVRSSLFNNLGPDSGGDVSDHMIDIVKPLCRFLDKFDDKLKCVLYCLDPGHQADLATVSRAFGAKVKLGSAWWLNDTPIGMERQLEYIGSVDVLSQFAGMVSDSRKLLSYASRFNMFRRVLSNTLGNMVDRGQMPLENAIEIGKIMSYSGPKNFFGF